MTLPLRLAALTATAIAAAPTGRGWYAAMERAVAQGHTAAWLAGTAERLGVKPGGALLSQARLSRAERADIKAQVAAQLKYLEGFAAAREGMSEAQAAARAKLYAGATQTTFYAARWGDWEIPGELIPGTAACLGNCRCSINVVDSGDGTGTLTRVMGGEHHCTECPPLAGDHPVTRRGAATKQTAQERAMFANMGSSGGGGGGGSAGGGKPTGGTGGLWKRNPETGRREPGQGLENAAAPKAGGSEAKPPTPEKPAPKSEAIVLGQGHQPMPTQAFRRLLPETSEADAIFDGYDMGRQVRQSVVQMRSTDMIATQHAYDSNYLKQKQSTGIPGYVEAYRYKGEVYIMDGHHRALLAYLKDEMVSVKIRENSLSGSAD